MPHTDANDGVLFARVKIYDSEADKWVNDPRNRGPYADYGGAWTYLLTRQQILEYEENKAARIAYHWGE